MNLSEEKQQLYTRLHDWMYRESIRTHNTPLPKELEDPKEWDAFVEWRHQNWRRICEEDAREYRKHLLRKEAAAAEPAMVLAEDSPPYPSKS